MYLHSINAGVFWMSPVALHQKLDILKGSGKIILQRKRVRGKKKWGCEAPRCAQWLSPDSPVAKELQKTGERGCGTRGLQVGGLLASGDTGQAAGVLPGMLLTCMHCTFSRKSE